ncbi:MAG: LptF/LptG family permease [Candidatus Marinimicrobia bacterium]|nr:LptF/LptG family permease [Candidatus Neomarinimicrobiota bacterium]MBL7022804.1 LptF/LptG family permease [Candidatus Neomarinimicrobiota bacterium]MBL7109371.1 LptF/LptG family permease [Candidatus Neomarinimicrobiota bacterium]
MKLLSRYILREHTLPFSFALVVLTFVLLTNFLLRTIDRFLGKGLSISILLEYMFLNLAWILALAVPMAVLIATLMAFGRMSSDNEITAIRSSGMQYSSILLPSLMFGILICIGMTLFNNLILPELNHKARLLSSDISRKRPDLEFDVGYFIESLPDQSILIGSREENIFKDITIFSKGKNVSQRTITANSGTIETIYGGVVLHLSDGVIHELGNKTEEYKQIYFTEYQVIIPIDNLTLTRRDSKIRGDREMTFTMINSKISGYHNKINDTKNRIISRVKKEDLITEEMYLDSTLNFANKLVQDSIVSNLSLMKSSLINVEEQQDNKKKIAYIKRRFKNLIRGITSDFKLIGTYEKSINKYSVELHKKFSIPFASIIFILIGAPLGIMARKGGFAISMALSLGFFIIYWGFLISGEELADRGLLSPIISMWMPNIILGLVGVYLCYFTSREQHFLKFEFLKLFKFRKNGKKND